MTTIPTSPSTSETIKRGFAERYEAEQIERAAKSRAALTKLVERQRHDNGGWWQLAAAKSLIVLAVTPPAAAVRRALSRDLPE